LQNYLILDKVYTEHNLRKIRLAVFIFVVTLHGLLFFFVSVEYQDRATIRQVETATLKLVNIGVEEAEPSKLSKSTADKTAPPLPHIQATEQKETAENFIEIEEAPADESVATEYEENPVNEPASEQYTVAGNEEKTSGADKGGADNAALAREYVKRNFDYISRRVRSKLVYPVQARRTGVGGIVEVLFILNTDGSVSGVSVKKSAGAEMLDEAAIAAIKSAAPFRAPPVSTKLLIPVVFNLRQ
jgi:protein TonB